jgi:FtsH ternary system domain X3
VRVRVKFRYRTDTGEVELFQVDDLHVGPPLLDHDARHERAAADVARVVESNALIEEMPPGFEMPATERTPAIPEEERSRQQDRSVDG